MPGFFELPQNPFRSARRVVYQRRPRSTRRVINLVSQPPARECGRPAERADAVEAQGHHFGYVRAGGVAETQPRPPLAVGAVAHLGVPGRRAAKAQPPLREDGRRKERRKEGSRSRSLWITMPSFRDRDRRSPSAASQGRDHRGPFKATAAGALLLPGARPWRPGREARGGREWDRREARPMRRSTLRARKTTNARRVRWTTDVRALESRCTAGPTDHRWRPATLVPPRPTLPLPRCFGLPGPPERDAARATKAENKP